MILLQPLYHSLNPERQAEIDYCLEQNKQNPLIEKIKLLNTREYAAFFEQSEGITIIANSDIYFDETLALAKGIQEGEVYCLSRWDKTDQGLKHLAFPDTQDAWIFIGPIDGVGFFDMGTPGCDNKIAYELKISGYKILNPSCSIRAIHVHNSNVRTYTDADRLQKPFLLVHPHKLYEESLTYCIE